MAKVEGSELVATTLKGLGADHVFAALATLAAVLLMVVPLRAAYGGSAARS